MSSPYDAVAGLKQPQQSNNSAAQPAHNAPGLGGMSGINAVGIFQQSAGIHASLISNTSTLCTTLTAALKEFAAKINNTAKAHAEVQQSINSNNQFIMLEIAGRLYAIAVVDGAPMSMNDRNRYYYGYQGNQQEGIKGLLATRQEAKLIGDRYIATNNQSLLWQGLIGSIPSASLPTKEDDAKITAGQFIHRILCDIYGDTSQVAIASGMKPSVIYLSSGATDKDGNVRVDRRLVAQNDHTAVHHAIRDSGGMFSPYSHPALSVVTSMVGLNSQNQFGYDMDNSNNSRQAIAWSTAFLDLRNVQQQAQIMGYGGGQVSNVLYPRVVITEMGSGADSLISWAINLAASASYYTHPMDPGYAKALIGMPDGNIGNLRLVQDDATRQLGPMSPDEIKIMLMNGGLAPNGRVDQNGQPMGSQLFMDMRNPQNSGVQVSILVDFNRGNIPSVMLRYFEATGKLSAEGVKLLNIAFPGIGITSESFSFLPQQAYRLICTAAGGMSKGRPVQLVIPTSLNLMGPTSQYGALNTEQQWVAGSDIQDPQNLARMAELATSRQLEVHGYGLEWVCTGSMISQCAAIAQQMSLSVATGDSAMSGLNTMVAFNPAAFVSTHQNMLPNNFAGGHNTMGSFSGTFF